MIYPFWLMDFWLAMLAPRQPCQIIEFPKRKRRRSAR